MTKLQLPNVTLIAVGGSRQAETIASMYKSMAKVDFAECVFVTNIDISATGIMVVNVGGLKTWKEYNHFIVKELYKYFTTSHSLIVQYDSWVLDADCWDDEFLNYDLIGARGMSDGRNNYNGGFSLRSHQFQKAIAQDDFIDITAPEDEILCRLYRSYLEETYQAKYCTDEIADKFAFELHQSLQKTFGFHNFHWKPFKEVVVIKRSGALGDIVMAEPVLEYFYKQGNEVAIDTQDQFLGVYAQHYFPVIPKQHLNPKLPYSEVNLDMAYEIKPTQPVLQSYFEIAGIKNVPLRNSRLNLRAGENQKLFEKYILIHLDDTGMPYRNSYGVNWKAVVMFLEDKGYLVFQIGRRVEKPIATLLNTMSLEFMMFVVKGADLVIALDSGVAQVSVGFNVPTVIMAGSVNLTLRYTNFERIRVVQSECPIPEKKNCYHEEAGRVIGSDCVVDNDLPPCTKYTATQVINAIKELI